MEKTRFDHAKDKINGMFKNEDIQNKKDKLVEKISGTYEVVHKRLNKGLEPRAYILFEGKSIVGLVKSLEELIVIKKKMELKEFTLADGSKIIQARAKMGDLKQLMGLDHAITVHIKDYKNGQIEITLGESKWMDKAFAFAVTGFAFWPLMVSPVIGTYQQIKLKNDIEHLLDIYFEI